ncbi:MAG: FxsA family protein [Rhodobacterales bacterium]|nr:FxsA family protein [Rhodobacterales bacterium]
MWLLALFVVVPLIEIALFIVVGGWLTLWPTLGVVLATGVLGTFLVHQQARAVLAELHRTNRGLGNPLSPLAHGALIVIAGVLLLTPGFFTDAVGLALLIPLVRRAVIAALARRVQWDHVIFSQAQARQGGVIDGSYIDLDGGSPREPGPSDWTRH